MQRDGASNQQSIITQRLLDFAGQFIHTIANSYIADLQTRPALAAIEAQATRDERRDMLVYEMALFTRPSIRFDNSSRDYITERNQESDSDSDSH